MNESTFPGTEHMSGHLPTPAQPIAPTIAPTVAQAGVAPYQPSEPQPNSTPPRPAPPQRNLTPPENYAEMPRPTAKLTAEDMAPVNDPHGPRHKIGPTGR